MAKYRQDVHYLHTSGINTYRPIRSHNEGASGRFKSGKLDTGDSKHQPTAGQVAQALLLAVMLTIANLTVLESKLTERDDPGELTDADFDSSGPLPPHSVPAVKRDAPTERPPPPRAH
ncbi:hypothetical protein [Streptomyces prunicolor]|uniref:hypothetical protein n=1 Tax=Streptomyces prunicolor TaxID=67348 RepID=UPI0034454FC7